MMKRPWRSPGWVAQGPDHSRPASTRVGKLLRITDPPETVVETLHETPLIGRQDWKDDHKASGAQVWPKHMDVGVMQLVEAIAEHVPDGRSISDEIALGDAEVVTETMKTTGAIWLENPKIRPDLTDLVGDGTEHGRTAGFVPDLHPVLGLTHLLDLHKG